MGIVPFFRYLKNDDIVPTDKMADLFFHFGRKCQTKNLVSPKKSSTFVASKEKKISIN